MTPFSIPAFGERLLRAMSRQDSRALFRRLEDDPAAMANDIRALHEECYRSHPSFASFVECAEYTDAFCGRAARQDFGDIPATIVLSEEDESLLQEVILELLSDLSDSE